MSELAEIAMECRKLHLVEEIAAHASNNFKRCSELRLEALKHAVEITGVHSAESALSTAAQFYSFLTSEVPLNQPDKGA